MKSVPQAGPYAVFACLVLSSLPLWQRVAVAQTSPMAAAAEATAGVTEPEQVVVTGSFLPKSETEGALPVSVLPAAEMIKLGAQTPAEALRLQPSYIGFTATENDSNGGTGAANISLRGLGPSNTLTLINGRRAFPAPGGFVGGRRYQCDWPRRDQSH